jgi:hypothetical protein
MSLSAMRNPCAFIRRSFPKTAPANRSSPDRGVTPACCTEA